MKQSDIGKDFTDWLDVQGISYRNPYTPDALWRKWVLGQNGKELIVRSIKTDQNVAGDQFQYTYRTLKQMVSRERDTGVSSVIIWPDQWMARRSQVQSRLLALLGKSQTIPARLTVLRRITKPEAEQFLENNHLQGAVSSRIKYGLFLPSRYYRVLAERPKGVDDERGWLVAVATFSHPRTFVNEGISYKSYEMIRFANAIGTTVVGGLEKLIRHLVREYQPGDLMTYADLDWSDGISFRKLGFKEVSDTEPVFFALNDRCRRIAVRGTKEPDTRALVMNLGGRKLVRSFRQQAPKEEEKHVS